MDESLESYISESAKLRKTLRDVENLPTVSDKIFTIVAEGELIDHLNDGWVLVDRWITRVDHMHTFDLYLYMYLVAKDRSDTGVG